MKYIFSLTFLLLFSLSAFAQTDDKKPKLDYSTATSKAIKSSPAYAALVLHRTTIRAELEEMLTTYTEDFPKVVDARHEIDLVNFELSRLLDTKVTDSCRLSDSLGKLILKKTEVEMLIWNLKKKYKDEHPDVQRANKKLEIYEKAIVEILP